MEEVLRPLIAVAMMGALGCGDLDQASGADDDDASTSSEPAPQSESDGSEDGSEPNDAPQPTALPEPTGPCPTFEEGRNEFCPDGLDECRHAWVVRAETGGGPLTVYWQASTQPPQNTLEFGTPAALVAMTREEGGLAVFPEPDLAAAARPEPFPWWVVETGPEDPPDDDFLFLDEIVGCAVDSGLVDEDRINTGGFGPGGIMTSFVLERRGYFASAVSWSGGHFESMTPIAPTPTVAIHGGPNDCYCDPMAPDDCYCFMDPSEQLALDMERAGAFAFVCDHSMGDQMTNHHADVLGREGVEFMRLARRGRTHEFDGYQFGRGGIFALDTYCYAPGDGSPWAPWN